MIKYTIINSAVNMVEPKPMDKEILYTIHNAGFFSNCTIRLQDILNYFNKNKRLPDEVDSSVQWLHYKSYPGDRLDTFYFTEQPNEIPYNLIDTPYITDCMAFQYQNYLGIKYDQLAPFIQKYFTPSEYVLNKLSAYEQNYGLQYQNLCSVFYRGNDKNREMKVSSYDHFINKAKEIKVQHPSIRFLVQPDETEFLMAFLKEFPDSIYFKETPTLDKKDSAVFFEMEPAKRKEYGADFMAAVLAISKCHTVITHSGNCGLWTALYRGNATNLHQIFNDQWL